ncbi:universal stress protein [Actinomadura scrupuli]|uniref:universal stress protein n=1 Tax=Actinomadura scrupuli TaxID=559629 RepID=UPI003D96182A
MSEIIAGVDGSRHSLLAAAWAAEEAARRGLPLRIVHAIPAWLWRAKERRRADRVAEKLYDSDRDVIDRAVSRVRSIAPGVGVSGELVPGGAAKALVHAAGHAAMVVVASHGSGGSTGLSLGSVALQVVAHASCPVVVVGFPEPAVPQEVVVGVDGSAGSQTAIGFAFEEASWRKARLRAVHTWTHPISTEPGDMLPLVYDKESVAADERRLLAESLAGWQEKYPQVEVVQEVLRSRPVPALSSASAGASLLVVGGRGRGGFTGLLLGSVSHAMLHHAQCPIAIIPLKG